MLLHRVLSAVVGIPVAVVLVCKGGLWLAIPVGLLTLIGLREFSEKARLKQIRLLQPWAYLMGLSFVGLAYARTTGLVSPEGYGVDLMGLLFVLVMGSLVVALLRYHRDQQTPVVAEVSATVLGTLYTGALFSFFVLLRDLYRADPSATIAGFPWFSVEVGARLLLLAFCMTWATDAGAYFTGRKLGRRKLTPASPNKTVEGAIGGWLSAIVVALVCGLWFDLSLLIALPAGILVGVTGQLGDLTKSIMKRDLGTKDFGNLIPGHGGVLDRFDSLLMNVPVVYGLAVLLG